jgi:hypothetical protein
MHRLAAPPPGRVIARWSDGAPAATETALGTGCLRAVAVSVPAAGDLPLTPAFRHFLRVLLEPCQSAGANAPASDRLVASVLPAIAATTADTEPAIASASVAPRAPRTDRLAAWLLALAVVAGVTEMFVRRGDARATA